MRCYGFAQTIETDIPVAGAIAEPSRGGRPGIRVTRSDARIPPAELYRYDGEQLVFSAQGVASYACRSDAIVVSPHPQADAAWIEALLIATALPAVLWMQGRFVLHAAGVLLAGQRAALAIAGPSGGGKSMLAAELVRRGASLLGDDSLSLGTGPRVTAAGLPAGLHLRASGNDERSFIAVPPAQSTASAALGAIVVLRPAGEQSSPRRLDPLAAMEQLLALQHRPRVPAMLGKQGAVVAQAAALASTVPVFLWERGDGHELEQDEWDTLGELTGKVRNDGNG